MNRGARDLSRKLKLADRGACSQLARDVGVYPSDVSHWISGRNKPSARNRIAIERLYGTPIMAWDEPVSRRGAAA